jgi:hypothetical protein
MPTEPYVKRFGRVTYPILTGNDLAKGLWRGTYEGIRGRPLKTVMGHATAQVIGSAVGRAVDASDQEITGFVMLEGQNMVMSSVVTSLVSGGIDTIMSRGNKFERFGIPIAVDLAVDWAAPKIYNGNPRIL